MAGHAALPARRRRQSADGSPTRDDAGFVEAAWLYYHDGLNQNEIAARMKISRASVVNYLNEARARGWVRLYMDSNVFTGHRLAGELCRAYGLAEALIAPDDPADPAASAARVTRAAADWLPRLLAPGDRLGVSWGETVYRMAQVVVQQTIEDLTVVQLVGSRPATLGFAAEACTAMLAQKLGGDCVNLHVPLLLSSKDLRDRLCEDPVVSAQLRALANCNKTVLACGICDAEAHVVKAGVHTASSVAQFRAQGAVGVICGRLIDANGRPVLAEAEDRMIGVTLGQMRGKEMSLLVAAGIARAESARAAIMGGYVTHLATSTEVAERLLAEAR